METLVTLGDRSMVIATVNAIEVENGLEGPEVPTTVTLYDVKYIPGFMLKLFSPRSCVMKKGENIYKSRYRKET